MKKQVRGPVLASLTVLALLGVFGGVNTAIGQTTAWHVVQASDGTLYVLIGGSRYTLQADPISDADLAGVPDAGPLGPFLSGPPPGRADTTIPPDFSGLPSTTAPDFSGLPSTTAPDLSGSPSTDVSASPSADQSTAPSPDLSAPPSADLSASPSPEVSVSPGLEQPPAPPSPPGAPAAIPAPSAPATIAGPTPRPGVVVSPAGSPGPGGGNLALASPTAAAGGLVSPGGVEPPVLLSGSGSQTTRAFTLRGGTYSALWSATANAGTADTFAAFLRPADSNNPHAQVIATALVPNGRSASGQVQLANLPAGTYAVDVVAGTTTWTLSLSAQAGPSAGR